MYEEKKRVLPRNTNVCNIEGGKLKSDQYNISYHKHTKQKHKIFTNDEENDNNRYTSFNHDPLIQQLPNVIRPALNHLHDDRGDHNLDYKMECKYPFGQGREPELLKIN